MRRLLPFLLASLAAVPAFGNLDLTLRVATAPYRGKSLAMRSAGEREKPKQTIGHVTLAPSFDRYDEDGTVTIRDFATRRVFVIDRKGAVEQSLFGYVGGWAYEMENRRYLAKMLTSASAEGGIPLVVSEHEISMLSGEKTDEVKRSETKDAVQFRAANLELAEYSRDMVEATAAERAEFVRFVRYDFHAHPVILADLLHQSGIPRSLRIVQHTSSLEFRITVSDVKRTADEPYAAPANAHLGIESADRIGDIARKALAGLPPDIGAKLSAEAVAFIEANQPLDAFLTVMEYHMMLGGVPATPVLAGSPVLRDPNVVLLGSALKANSESSARAALATYAKLHEATKAKGYILSIFEGDTHANLGDADESYAAFLAALTERPTITGVWKDAGEEFLKHYDAQTAWDCWTIARRLRPEHEMLKQIAEREASLVSEHPEFF